MSKPGFLKSALAGASGLWQKRARHPDFPDIDDADPERQGQALFRRGRYRMRAGEIEVALKDFDRAIELLPDFAEALASHAECLDMLGRVAGGAAGVREGPPAVGRGADRSAGPLLSVSPAGPADLRGRVLRAGAEAHQDRLLSPLGERQCAAGAGQGRGSAALLRGAQVQGQGSRAAGVEGRGAVDDGALPAAVDAFSSSLRANPSAPETLSGRAIAFAAIGRIDKANDDWRSQLSLLPEISRPREPAWRCGWPTMRRRCPSSSARSRRRRATLLAAVSADCSEAAGTPGRAR